MREGSKHTKEVRLRISKTTLGRNQNKANAWKGSRVGYYGIHAWLRTNFGKAVQCESLECKRVSKRYQWALKKGCQYERRRENFIELCFGCHSIYDGKIEKMTKVKLKRIKVTKNDVCIYFNSIKQAARRLNVTANVVDNALHGRSSKLLENYKLAYD